VPFVLASLVLALTISLARGGRPARIALVPLRRTWLLFLGVALQVATDVGAAAGIVGDASRAGWVLLLLSQLVILAWLAHHWYLPGVALVTLGLTLNAVVMAANGAMPVDPAAIAALGVEGVTVNPGKHTLLTEATRLPWLADRLPLPPLRTVISVGDVVLAAGLLPLVHHLMTYRSPAERRGGSRSKPAPAALDERSGTDDGPPPPAPVTAGS
jgi:hypothetical protein